MFLVQARAQSKQDCIDDFGNYGGNDVETGLCEFNYECEIISVHRITNKKGDTLAVKVIAKVLNENFKDNTLDFYYATKNRRLASDFEYSIQVKSKASATVLLDDYVDRLVIKNIEIKGKTKWSMGFSRLDPEILDSD